MSGYDYALYNRVKTVNDIKEEYEKYGREVVIENGEVVDYEQ
jgi:hypothetical protein